MILIISFYAHHTCSQSYPFLRKSKPIWTKIMSNTYAFLPTHLPSSPNNLVHTSWSTINQRDMEYLDKLQKVDRKDKQQSLNISKRKINMQSKMQRIQCFFWYLLRNRILHLLERYHLHHEWSKSSHLQQCNCSSSRKESN